MCKLCTPGRVRRQARFNGLQKMKKKKTYTCESVQKTPGKHHVVFRVGLYRDACGICGGSIPPIKLPRCKGCAGGMKMEKGRFNELQHQLRTSDHPFIKVPDNLK